MLDLPDVTDVGDTYRCVLCVTDLEGVQAAADSVTVTVTLPSGGTAAGTATATTILGVYVVEHDVTEVGRHQIAVAVASTAFGNDVISWCVTSRATTGVPPDMSAVRSYLGDTSATDEEIADALEAEQAAQARACTIPADYPPDLAQALKRRVARNLAARSVPLVNLTTFEGGGSSNMRVPWRDAEIARLEAAYRRWTVA
jgi:hypothetical protein